MGFVEMEKGSRLGYEGRTFPAHVPPTNATMHTIFLLQKNLVFFFRQDIFMFLFHVISICFYINYFSEATKNQERKG
ncbi:MAG: hypothetical protein Q8P67_18010, partial [archaeon]|nr:hypothetical protein [archaeon]